MEVGSVIVRPRFYPWLSGWGPVVAVDREEVRPSAVIHQHVQGASRFLQEIVCHPPDVMRWIQGIGCHCASLCHYGDMARSLCAGGRPSSSYPLCDFVPGVMMLQGSLQGVSFLPCPPCL